MPFAADKREKRRWGCTIFGWLLFLILLTAIIFVGYRTWKYYDLLRRGELVDLPQFGERLTATGERSLFELDVVDRDSLEGGDFPSLGAATEDAELIVVEFGDFECPYCKEAAVSVRQMAAKYGGRVRFLFRQYPIESMHPSARSAALASLCAHEQDGFWAYHDKLFANQGAFGFQDLVSYAQEIGLDTAVFEECLVSERQAAAVEDDVRSAKVFGVIGTPVFFFDGQKVEGAIPPDRFDRIISRLIE